MFTYSYPNLTISKNLLSHKDDFLNSLSNLEMSIRMKENNIIDIDSFITHLCANVICFEKEDQEKIDYAMNEINKIADKLQLNLNGNIQFIKTTGYEEEHCGYTRQNAIILPIAKIKKYTKEKLVSFIAHEIFHILSRRDKNFRRRMYALIGFTTIENLELPLEISVKKITNPDAPLNDYFFEAFIDNEKKLLAPILVFNKVTYDATNSYFASIEEIFSELKYFDGTYHFAKFNGEIIIHSKATIKELSDFPEGIIQPDEILAEHFAELITSSTSINNNKLLSNMQEIIQFYNNRFL